MSKALLATRITVTILMLLPTCFLLAGLAFGGVMAKASPTYREPSGESQLLGGLYVLATVACAISAVWIRSRPLLVVATLLLLPFLLMCGVISFFVPLLAPSLLLPLIWITFFFIAWPAYAATQLIPRKPPKILSPEEY